MADTSNENLGIAEIPSAPPPPPDVKVRTMQSDLEAMSRPGGGPEFKSVKAPKLPAYDEIASEEEPSKEVNQLEERFAALGGGDVAAAVAKKERAPENKESEVRPKMFWPVVFVAVVALIVLAAIIYLAYSIFFGGGNVSGTSAPAATQGQTQQYTNPQPVGASFTHATLFSKPVDQTLTLTLSSAAQNASDLQTFPQRFSGIFAGARPTSTFFEIDAKKADGTDAYVNDIFSAADTAVLDPQYVLAHFNPDATVFAYKDANGIWPGYVLKLKPAENWLFLKDNVAKLEAMTTKIENFFLVSPGDPSAVGFQDVTAANSSFRALAFSQPGATFVYGWYQGYLMMSTSLDGLKQAIARL